VLANIVCLREMKLCAHYYSVAVHSLAASHLLALAMIDVLLFAEIDCKDRSQCNRRWSVTQNDGGWSALAARWRDVLRTCACAVTLMNEQ
jgi:hypothetical protein